MHDAERAFGFALTERTVGGSGGGGSQLTAEARELIERYRAFERTSRWALSASYETCFSGFADVPRLGCVVMASGEGARFGGAPDEKLVTPLAGTAVLERTLAALPADLLDVVVVTRWDAVEGLCGRLGVRCVRADGPLKSDTMRAGLEALGHRAGCLFVTGDQPLLSEKSVRSMVAALTHEPTAIVRLSWHGRPANRCSGRTTRWARSPGWTMTPEGASFSPAMPSWRVACAWSRPPTSGSSPTWTRPRT